LGACFDGSLFSCSCQIFLPFVCLPNFQISCLVFSCCHVFETCKKS
jgi:hypothetical protein